MAHACAHWMVHLCCVFATGVAGWQHDIIVFVGYEVGAIGPTGHSLGSSWDYVIDW